MKSNKAVGIDLGTTTSQVAVLDKTGIVKILPDLNGDTTIPSIVSVAGDKPVVGKFAKQDKFFSPDLVAEHFKKLMSEVDANGEPIAIITSPDGTEYTPVILSAEVLRYLKESAEKIEGCEFKKAAISVPAYFKEGARQRTKDAGLIAGFEEVYIENEPVAAATYYGLTKNENIKLAVFDFGGGTFDICILDIKDGKTEVIAVDGDPECGGSNIDEAIFQKVKQFLKEKGKELDPEKDLVEWLEVLELCKQAKETLAQKDTALIPLKIGDKRTSLELTCEQLKECAVDEIKTLTDCCKKVLKKANLQPSDIGKILTVGGSSRLRFIPEIIKIVFGKEPVSDTDLDLAVAKGNAIIAAVHFGEPDEEIIIEGQKFLTSAIKTLQIAVRDLCVAAVTKRDQGDMNLYNAPIIPAGSKLPFEATECFTPIESQTSAVAVKLIDGSPGELSENSTPLEEAEVKVQPTNEADNGDRIEFKIRMNEEGLVDLKVRDKILNKPIPIKFNFKTGLSDKEIDGMKNQLELRHKS
ncbi:MAG: Hsp70 family protein [Anaerohalosphaeraceae bacterium]|nr:Hsp70 family protein [Anaerohalosphaeraceae bacterium]